MESPIFRKAILNATFDGIAIVIPKKNSKNVVFLSVWLSAWAVGEIILLFLVISDSIKITAMWLFAMVFVLAWTVIGISW